MNRTPPQTATRPGSLQRLTERAALWFEREDCLTVRFPYVGCDRVTIMDRGWCADCPAGGDRHPAREAMAEANRLLGPSESAIRIERQPLPQQVAAGGIPHPLDQRPTGRRGFLRRLAGEAVAIRLPDETSSDSLPHDGNRRIEPTEQLARLAAFPDEPPAALLPTLTLGALGTQGLVYGIMGMRPFRFGATLPLYFLAGALVVGLALVILLTNLAHDLNRDKMPEPTRQLMGSTLPNVLLVVLALYRYRRRKRG